MYIKINFVWVLLCLSIFSSTGYAQPNISVNPTLFNVTLNGCTDSSTSSMTINNTGSSDLIFDIDAGGPEGALLQDILTSLNENYSSVTSAIPDLYNFTEGSSIYYIADGGDDMYDYGNYLHTDYWSYIYYSENQITTNSAFGTNSSHFTKKNDGLFVLTANIDSISYFEITGNLGADSDGFADTAILRLTLFGKNYLGFVKRVHSAFKPSVNHLIIVEEGDSIKHNHASDTYYDQHRVYNLQGSTRLYYLLYSSFSGGTGTLIDNATTLDIMEKFLRAVDPMPTWLSLSKRSDTLAASGSTNIDLTFFSTEFIDGNYNSILYVNSNDLSNPKIAITCTLGINGVPEIVMSDTCLQFGSIMEYTTMLDTLYFANTGCDTLNITDINSTLSEYSVNDTAFVLAPGDSDYVVVTFAPISVGTFNATLTLINDAGDTSICLTGSSFAKPLISVNPDSLSVTIASCDDSLTKTITISNTGTGNLIYNINGIGLTGIQSASCIPYTTGYCCGMGIYNVTFNNINNNTNPGWDSYQDYSDSVSTIVTPGQQVILSVTTGTSYNEHVVVWIDFNNNGSFEASEKVMESVNIMQNHIDTITIPNNTATGVGLRMRVTSEYYNNAVPGPCTNVQYGQTEDYAVVIMEMSSQADTLLNGESKNITIKYKSTGVIATQSNIKLLINSNDPLNPQIEIPSFFTVTGSPIMNLLDTCIAFDTIMKNQVIADTIIMTNEGCDTLFIFNIISSNSAFSVDTTYHVVLPWDTSQIIVYFSPTTAGSFTGNLDLFGNSGNQSICLSGYATESPTLVVDPGYLTVTINSCNDSITKVLKIKNTGNADLNWKFKTANNGGAIIITGTTMFYGARNNYAEPKQLVYNCLNYTIGTSGTIGCYSYGGTSSGNIPTLQSNINGQFGTSYSFSTINNGTVLVTNGQPNYDAVACGYNWSTGGIHALAQIQEYLDAGGNLIFGGTSNLNGTIPFLPYSVFNVNSSNSTFPGPALLPNHPLAENVIGGEWGYNSELHSYFSSYDTDEYDAVWGSGVLSVLVHDAMPNWLGVSLSIDTVTSADSSVINVKFKSIGLENGTYYSDLEVVSNDPLNTLKLIPCTLKVNGTPQINISDTCINFGSIMESSTRSSTITVYNNGCDTLFITDINNGLPEYSVNDTSFYILPFDSQNVVVTFAPSSVGTFNDNLTIVNDDINKTICLNGSSFAKPNISANPLSFNNTITSCNDSITEILKLYNTGVGDLIYTIGGSSTIPKAPACQPITYGYCCGMGIYNVQFNTINYSSADGSESYQDYSSAASTEVLPGITYSVYVQTSTGYDEHVVIWIDWDNSGTFETSEEVFYDLVRTNHNGTIQIPNNAVTGTALRMRVVSDYYNEAKPTNCTDVRYGQVEDYSIIIKSGITFASITDTISVNDSASINIQFNSTGLANGNYVNTIVIESNDPLNPTLLVPCSLTINGTPQIALSNICLNLDSAMELTTNKDSLYIYNNGCDTLKISNITNALSEYSLSDTVLNIPPYDSAKIIISFAPTSTGLFKDTLKIFNNDVQKDVCLTGVGTPKVIINTSPQYFKETITTCNDSITKTLTIYNNGGDDLNYNVVNNSALDFNGTSDYVQIYEPSLFDVTDFTFSVWFNATAFSGWRTIIDIDNDEQLLGINNSQYAIYGRCGTKYHGTATVGWHYLTWTVSGSNYILYEDGVQIGSGTTCNFSVNATYLMVGSGLGGNEYFQGAINEVSFWNKALTQSDIVNNMNNGLTGSENGLIGYWPFDEGTGTTAYDNTANINNGTITGATWTQTSAAWIQGVSGSGTILPGDSAQISIKFNSSGLNSGTYSSQFKVKSNDPVTPQVVVPCSLIVQGYPVISLSQITCFNLDSIMEYTTHSDTLTISNNGCDTLKVTSLTTATTQYTLSDASMNLLPGESRIVIITFQPTATGTYLDTIAIASNDGNYSICMSGESYAKPIITASADSFIVSINSCNDSLVIPLKVYNSGTGILSFTSQNIFSAGGTPIAASCAPITTGTCCGMGIYNVTLGDINNTTNPGTDSYQDYTATQSTAVVPGGSYSISIQTGTSYNEHSRVWIDFNNNGSFESSEEVFATNTTYQYHTGTINIPLDAVTGTPLRMRVATEYYNNSAPSPCTAVQYGQFEDYTVIVTGGISINISSGTVVTGDSSIIDVKFKTNGLISGLYTSSIIINSNDPLNPQISIPAKLTINGSPSIAISTSCIAMDSIMELTSITDTLQVINNGCDSLFISNITKTDTIFSINTTSFALAPYDTGEVIITFSPNATGTFLDTLTILNNDVTKTVCLSGTGLAKAIISSNPTSFNETITSCNDSITKVLKLYNSGIGDLIYTINGTSTIPTAPSCQPITWGYCCSMGIYNVQFNTINYTSGNGSQSYQDYTALASTEVLPGQSYAVYVQTGTSYDEHVVIWIDWDNSGTFETSEEIFYSVTRTNHNGTILIPSNAVTGTALRMRVASDYSSQPKPTNCTDVRYGQVEDYSIIISDGINYPTVTDTVAGGDSASVNIEFKSSGLLNGIYVSNILVNSNDPLNSSLAIPCTLNIQGAPAITLADSCFYLDSIMDYTTHTDTMIISNTGCDTLNISNITNVDTAFSVDLTTMKLAPGESGNVIITFNPQSVGVFNDTLQILNDATNLSVCLSGKSYAKPAISTNPSSYNVTINACDDTITNFLKVFNTGSGILTYNIPNVNSGGNAGIFDGSGDYVNANDINAYDLTNAVTFETWIYINTIQETWTSIIGKPGRNYTMWLHSSGYIHFSYNNTGGSNITLNTPSSTINTGQWHHVACVLDVDAAIFKIYVDGVEQANGAPSGYMRTSTYPFRMGNNLDNGSGNYLNGKLDEVRVWNRDLSQAEIQANMNRSLWGYEQNLIGYWNFNDGAVTDLTSNNNDGTFFGNAYAGISDAPVYNFVFTDITSDTITSGDSTLINFNFTSTGKNNGKYTTLVNFNSNDPINPILSVPCTLTVNGTPTMSLSAACLTFDTTMQMTSSLDTLTITNTGCDTLIISTLSNATSVFTLDTNALTLVPGNSYQLIATFSPTSTATYTDTITLVSNTGTQKVCLTGVSSGSPTIVVIPSSLSATISTCGDSLIQNIKIKNTGTGVLYVDGQEKMASGRSGLFANSSDYTYISGDVPITSTGAYTLESWAKFPLPNTGNYRTLYMYSSNRHHVLVNSSGLLGVYYYGFYSSGFNVNSLSDGWHFISSVASSGKTDFYVDGVLVGTSAYYLNYNLRYLGNYYGGGQNFGTVDEMRAWNYARTSTQIKASMNQNLIGNESGLLAYWNYDGGTANDQSLNTYNGTFNNAATTVNGNFDAVSVASFTTSLDTVAIGDSITMAIKFYSKGLGSGTYIDSLEITSNDPVTPSVTVLSTLTVNGYPKLAFSDSCLAADSTMELTSSLDTIKIYNQGCDSLSVTNITKNGTIFSINSTTFNLAPGDSALLIITFSPPSSGSYLDTLKFTSNDVNLDICLSGYSFGQAAISLDPTSYNFTVTACVDSITKPLKIKNTGQSDLNWNVQVPDAAGSMLVFDGYYDAVYIGNTNLNNISTAITTEGWIYPRVSDAYQYVVSNDRDCCGSYKGYSLRIYNGYPLFQIWDDSYTVHAVQSSVALPINEWHHLAGTFDGTTLKIYVDGELMSTASYTGTIGTPSTYNLYLGGMGYNYRYCVDGYLDDVRIWDIARTQAEIKSSMNSTLSGSEANLQGYWNFDEGTGNPFDQTSNGYNGTRYGNTYWSTSSIPVMKLGSDLSSGTVAPGDSSTINIKFYFDGFESSTVYTSFAINSNDPTKPSVTVPCTLTVKSPSSVPVALDTTICFGNPTPNLTATGDSIKWYKNAALDTVVANGTTYATGETAVGVYTYYITQTIDGCESVDDTATLIINGSASAPVVTDSTICDESTIPTFTAIGTYIEWYSDGGLLNLVGTGSAFTPTDSTVGTHNYYVTDSVATCSKSSADTVSFIILAKPVTPTVSDSTICYKDATPTITASGTNVKWYSDAGLTIVIDTTNSYKPVGDTLPGIYSYYVTQTSGSCESNATIVSLTINSTPAAPIVTNKSICFGSPTPDLSTSGTNIQWYSDGSLTTLVNSGDVYTTGKIDSGIYTYYITDSVLTCPQSISDTVTLTIYGTPMTPVVADTTICFGDPTPDLIAAGTNVRWFTNASLTALVNSGSPFVTGITDDGTYPYYVIQNVNGCVSSTATQTLTINKTPQPVAADTTICFGQSTPNLTATGTSVKWYDDATLTSLVNSGNTYTTGNTAVNVYTYYATQTLNTCESFADTVILTINAAPSAPTGTDTTICYGDPSPTLSSTGTYVRWYKDSGLDTLLKTGSTYAPGKTAVGTYNYYVTDSTGNCPESAADIVTLTINSKPSVPVSNDAASCFGSPTPDLTATGTDIKWYDNAALTSLAGTGNTFATGKTAVDSYIYYVTQTVSNCESDAVIVELTINAPLATPTVSDKTVCFGTTPATLATSGNYIRWYDDAALTSLVKIGTSYSTPDTAIGSYQYYVTDSTTSCPETVADTVILTIDAIPVPPTTSDTTVCYGATTPDLTATGTSVSWYLDSDLIALVYIGNTFATGKTAADTYNYYVTQTVAGCESFADTSTLVIDLTAPPTVSDTGMCEGAPVPDLTVSGTNIKWYDDAPLTNLVGTGNSYTTGKTAIGNYTYYVTQTVSSCISGGAAITLSINGKPAAPAVNDTIVCETNIGIDLSVATAGTVEWYSDDALTNQLFIGNPFTSNDTTVGTYSYYIIENNAGCLSEKDSIKMTVNATPAAPTSSDTAICVGNTNPTLTATGTNVKWFSDAGLTALVGTGNNYIPTDTIVGAHDYYVTDSVNNCVGPSTMVTFNITATPGTPTTSDSTICKGSTAILVATGTNVNWYSDAGLTIKVGSVNAFATGDTAIGNYKYYVTDGLAGCESSADSATLSIISSPSIPTGNDTTICFGTATPDLTASGSSLKWYSDSTLTTLVWTGNNYATGKTASGTYDYYVTQSVGSCESPADMVTLSILPSVVAPTSSDTAICAGNPTPDLIATGNYLQWYSDSTLQTLVHTGSSFATGETAAGTYEYFVTDSIIGCGTSSAIKVTLTIVGGVAMPTTSDTTICFGQTVPDLTAIGTSIFWYSDSTLTTLVNTGSTYATGKTTSGTYKYFVTDSLVGCGQSAATTATLTINSNPSQPVAQDTAACFGNSVPDLNASGTNVKWYADSALDTLLASANTYSTGETAVGSYDYFVTQTDGSTGCISIADTVILTITNLPATPTVLGDTTGCYGSVNPPLSATGSNINWYSDSGLSNLLFTGSSFVSSDTTVGTHTYYVTDGFSGCESTADSAKLTIQPAPSAPTTTDTSICFGLPAPDLTATGTALQWYSDSLLLNLVGTGSNYTPTDSIIGSYNYYVTQFDLVQGCASPASEAIFTVEPGPNAPVSSDTSICFGLAPTLFAQGTNVKWYSDSLLNNLVNSGNSFTTSDSSVGTYTYYLTDSISGCVSSITEITLEINSVATPPAVSDQTICQGENSPLFTAAGGNVRWYSDSTLKTLIQIGNSFKSQESDIGTYTYYLTDGLPGSCMSAKSNATLTILGKPSTPVVFDKAACFGGTVPAFTTSGSNISWYSDSSLVVLMGTGNSYAAGDTAVGSYDYFVIDSSNGCISDIASATVTIGSSLPSPNVTSETVCETSTIPALIASGSNVSWYDDAGLSSLVNTGNSFTSTKTESGTYTYFVTDSVSAGCVSSASSGVLTIVAVASAPVTSDTSSCYGETPPALIASGTNVTWFSDAELANRIHNGDTLNTGILDFGTYIYYVTDSNATCGQGPASTASLTINTNPLVTTNKLTITIGFGDSTELEAYNASTYEWFPSTGLSDTVGSLVMASPTADQVYAVIGTNKFGCSDSASITVFIDSTISINEATILSGLSIYPNPSLGRFTVEFYITGQHEPVDMCIMNGLGQILTQHELIPDNGEYKQVVNAEELAKGVYHLQLVTKKGTLNRLVVISK